MFRQIPLRDLAVEIGVGVAFLVSPLVVGILSDASPLVIVVTTGGMVTMGMFTIAQYESWRSPFRNRTLTGDALMKALDGWLRDNGYTRGPAQLVGYSHAIKVSKLEAAVWIAIETGRNTLSFMTSRSDMNDTFSTFMRGDQQLQLKYDIALEVTRMGAIYWTDENPYGITLLVMLLVDETLSEATILERVHFVERVDHLVQQLYGKHASAAMATTLPGLAAASRPLSEEESKAAFSKEETSG